MPEKAPEAFNALSVIMPLIGVVIGGLLTFGIQSRFRYIDRRRSRLERLHRVHMFTLFVIPDLLSAYRHVTEGVPPNPRGPLWPYIVPMLGFNPAYLTYDFDSLSVLGGRRNSPVLGRLYRLALERNASIATLHRYNERRGELIDALEPYTLVAPDGTVTFASYVTVGPVRRIEVEVESILAALRSDLARCRDEIYELEPTYNAMMRELQGKGEPNTLRLPPR